MMQPMMQPMQNNDQLTSDLKNIIEKTIDSTFNNKMELLLTSNDLITSRLQLISLNQENMTNILSTLNAKVEHLQKENQKLKTELYCIKNSVKNLNQHNLNKNVHNMPYNNYNKYDFFSQHPSNRNVPTNNIMKNREEYLKKEAMKKWKPLNQKKKLPKNQQNTPEPAPNEISMVIHMDEQSNALNVPNSSNAPNDGTLGPLSILSSLFSSMNKNKDKDKNKDDDQDKEKYYDDTVSEYDSDDEFEELDINMEKGNLPDLIKLSNLYPKLIKEGEDNKSNEKSKEGDNEKNKNNIFNNISKKDNGVVNPLISLKNKLDDKKNMNSKQNEELSETSSESDDEEDNDSYENKDKTVNTDNTIIEARKLLETFGVQPKYLNKMVNKKTQLDTTRSHLDTTKSQPGNKSQLLSSDNNIRIGDIKVQHDESLVSNNKKSSAFQLDGKKYPLDLKKLNGLHEPLTKLNNLIGLSKVKDSIVDMILYFLQNFEKGNDHMLHTIIEGPPGVGKTELGKILADVYAALGITKNNKFKIAKRADLIGEFLGQTAVKTQKVIDEADGGVLFIDEAYALGHSEKRDSYSKECIDTLNQNLTENKRNFICIIAGYSEELETCFFSGNPGLKRRFPFKFSIDGYEPDELMEIFKKQINESQWSITMNDDLLLSFFKRNKKEFPHFGGDMENLLVECKFCHSRRVVGKHPKNRRKLGEDDINKGFTRYTNNKKKANHYEPPFGLYT